MKDHLQPKRDFSDESTTSRRVVGYRAVCADIQRHGVGSGAGFADGGDPDTESTDGGVGASSDGFVREAAIQKLPPGAYFDDFGN